MYDFYIKYESYMGDYDTMVISADTISDAKRIFYAQRPLSDIVDIEMLD